MNRFSKIILVTGILIIILEFISKIMLWPDLFNGFLIGFIMISTGLLLMLIRQIKKTKDLK